ncbi:McrB family protein [Gemmatimonadota bacterium]
MNQSMSEEPSTDTWDEFFNWGGRFFQWEGFDASERDYKLEIADNIKAARTAVLGDEEDWFPDLKRSFRSPNNLTFHIVHHQFLNWAETEQSECRVALQKLWNSSADLADRIREFLAIVPQDVVKSPGNRLSITSYLLMADDPAQYPIYRATPINKGKALVGYESVSDSADEAEIYQHALVFFDEMISQAHSRDISFRDRLDAQSVLWGVVKGSDILPWLSETEQQQLLRYRGELKSTWWVNQGQTYQQEREGSYVWAPQQAKNGSVLSHHLNVSKLQIEDVVIHYANGAIRAISSVAKKPHSEPIPRELPEEPRERDGWMCKLRYYYLDNPISLDEISESWRKDENGPFNREGLVKQTYLLPVSDVFQRNLRSQFSDRWPEGSPWEYKEQNVWLFQSNPRIWDLDAELRSVNIGDEGDWGVSRFKDEMKPGDPVVIWKAGDTAGIYALGELSSTTFVRERPDWKGPAGDNAPDETGVRLLYKTLLDKPIMKNDLLKHPILKELSVIRGPQGTNFRVSTDQWLAIQDLLKGGDPRPVERVTELSMEWLIEKTLWSREDLEDLVNTIESTSKQIVLAGPPGTSKTWVAKHLAQYLTKQRPHAYKTVQFHPSWGYEEFIEGLRPVSQGDGFTFKVKPGIVKEFVDSITDNNTYVLILDELNRANLPRVFGELMYLFEYRDESIDLQYSENFMLPSNLIFIGTMNTADRSIRSIDIALRRRFEFFECAPNTDVLRRYYEDIGTNELPSLYDGFEELNSQLTEILDRHLTIGHTFFMAPHMTREVLTRIWKRQIGPLIEEYFFDQPDLADKFTPEQFWQSG